MWVGRGRQSDGRSRSWWRRMTGHVQATPLPFRQRFLQRLLILRDHRRCTRQSEGVRSWHHLPAGPAQVRQRPRPPRTAPPGPLGDAKDSRGASAVCLSASPNCLPFWKKAISKSFISSQVAFEIQLILLCLVKGHRGGGTPQNSLETQNGISLTEQRPFRPNPVIGRRPLIPGPPKAAGMVCGRREPLSAEWLHLPGPQQLLTISCTSRYPLCCSL